MIPVRGATASPFEPAFLLAAVLIFDAGTALGGGARAIADIVAPGLGERAMSDALLRERFSEFPSPAAPMVD